jgi:hypothetical protein
VTGPPPGAGVCADASGATTANAASEIAVASRARTPTIVDAELACVWGRVQTELGAARRGSGSGATGDEAGGDPATVWRVIQACGNEESTI